MAPSEELRDLWRRAGQGDSQAAHELWDLEKAVNDMNERRILGIRFDPRLSLGNIVILFGLIAGGFGTFYAIREQINANTSTIQQNSKSLENLSLGFKTLGSLVSTLNSDNVLQRYQIEQIQRDIQEMRRDIREGLHK